MVTNRKLHGISMLRHLYGVYKSDIALYGSILVDRKLVNK